MKYRWSHLNLLKTCTIYAAMFNDICSLLGFYCQRIAQSVASRILTRETKVFTLGCGPVAVCVVVLIEPLMHGFFGSLSQWVMNE